MVAPALDEPWSAISLALRATRNTAGERVGEPSLEAGSPARSGSVGQNIRAAANIGMPIALCSEPAFTRSEPHIHCNPICTLPHTNQTDLGYGPRADRRVRFLYLAQGRRGVNRQQLSQPELGAFCEGNLVEL